jgi:hypothetical protein
MSLISDNYKKCCAKRSDINQHLPILKKYADECEIVVEMGVRFVTSTWSFLVSNAKQIISYDISYNNNIDYCKKVCIQEKRNWNFILESSLTCEIPETDLLFIDTFHTYHQLKAELNRHSEKVKKFIIIHDTTSFATKSANKYHLGLMNAIEEFVLENLSWKIKERLMNNNGLLILERIK